MAQEHVKELGVGFLPQFDELQRDLEQEDFSAEVEMQGPGGPGGGTGGRGIGVGGFGRLAGLLGSIIALLEPIKQVLDLVANILLRTLAPVFRALQPTIQLLQDVMLGIGRFLSGDLTLEEIIDSVLTQIVRALKQVANQFVTGISRDIPGVTLNQPFPGVQRGQTRDQSAARGRTEQQQGRDFVTDVFSPNDPLTSIFGVGAGLIRPYIPDRTDEANKDAMANQRNSARKDQPGGQVGP